jgi:hypothetical protein
MSRDPEEKLIVLFDEFGTPTFNKSNNKGIFLGVTALYKFEHEDKIFDDADKVMGLSKSKPLKNDKISSQKALDMTQQVGKHDLTILSKYISLKNNDLKEIIETYSKFGNLSRKIFRGIEKERKPAHILHTQISEYCLFDIISSHIVDHEVDSYIFEIYIDNWSYPTPDEHIVLKYAPENLEKQLRELINDYGRGSKIIIKPKEFLKGSSSKRKRFIDALTTIISRAFLDENDPKFEAGPLKELKSQLGNKFKINDYTFELTGFIRDSMYKYIQQTREKDENIIFS